MKAVIKNGYKFGIDVEDPKELHEFQNNLPFLPGKIKTKKCNKVLFNQYNKRNYVPHIGTLKQALNHRLILRKTHIVQFNQKAWLKRYVDLNTKLSTETTHGFEKYFFKLMNDAAFWRTVENLRKHREIKLVTTTKKRYLVSEPNHLEYNKSQNE